MALVRRLVLLLFLSLVVAACGSDDSSEAGVGDTDDTTTTVAETTTTLAEATTSTTTIQTTEGDGLVAQEGDTVAVHYVGTLDDGSEFDSSRGRGQTLDFEVGGGRMISGFDQAVRGMTEGEVKTVRLEPADAYGEVDPELIIEVQTSQVPEGTQAGDVLFDPNTGRQVSVTSVEGDVVTLDLNHELAGQTLTFEIEMVTITRS